MLAIGTGIGSGRSSTARSTGQFRVAPELGHLTIVPGGRRCSCGKAGCWERYCSGTALVDTVIELLANGDWGRSALAADVAADPGSLTGRRVARPRRTVTRSRLPPIPSSPSLGQGLAMIADIFDPDLIVLAGGGAPRRVCSSMRRASTTHGW